MSVEEIIENSQEKINFEDEDLYFGEMDIEYKEKHSLYDLYIAGDFKYIGMMSKKSKKP